MFCSFKTQEQIKNMTQFLEFKKTCTENAAKIVTLQNAVTHFIHHRDFQKRSSDYLFSYRDYD